MWCRQGVRNPHETGFQSVTRINISREKNMLIQTATAPTFYNWARDLKKKIIIYS